MSQIYWETDSEVSNSTQCSILAHAVVQVPLADVAVARRGMTLFGDPPFPKSFLKPADEQTVAAVKAVLQAIEDFGLGEVDFSRWGVVAAPQYFARRTAKDTIELFQTGGVWKVSPLFVPHSSLHSISGTISQALKIQGPNVGVGGSNKSVVEGLLASLTMQAMQDVPGVWTVFTLCEPEQALSPESVTPEDVTCHAVALALVPESASTLPSVQLIHDHAKSLSTTQPDLFQLIRFLERVPQTGVWSCSLSWGANLAISSAT